MLYGRKTEKGQSGQTESIPGDTVGLDEETQEQDYGDWDKVLGKERTRSNSWT